MKEIYVRPEFELTAYETEDVITTSTLGKDNDVSNNDFNKNSAVSTAWLNY